MSKSNFSRRKFISAGLLGTAGATVLPNITFAKTRNSQRNDFTKVRLGFIGLGRQARGLLNRMMSIPAFEVVAGADIYEVKLQRFKQDVEKNNADHQKSSGPPTLYADYKKLLANPYVDAVVIASPDHWHALMAIDACRAGKDIYLEKPLTFTIKEGQELIKAVRSNGTVLAVGSMQRSSSNFQHAVKMVQKGKLGKIKEVLVHVGEPPHPKPLDLPEQSIPNGLDWQTWIGPLPAVHYNEELNPPISLDPEENEKVWGAWRWYKETGGGLMTDWGAHMIDIAQWGLGMDRNGPTEVIPATVDKPLTYIYPNGTKMLITSFDEGRQGVKFIGEKGWIKVSRGNYDTSMKELEMPNKIENNGSMKHYEDFLDAVITRRDPFVPVEIGHSTCAICTIGNIAHELNRPLKWDPIAQVFLDDWEANTHLHYTYQNGYSLKS
ncbi:Gfo/Idh/MocA family oxidoreductase [Algoriphagus halophytocola]|uniref:Gfo/Idh/MocA family protein n=1 Tax=Algoriphagus halophytocola TaxID=2991499 RepID=UPI0022DDD13C|nr:Gfo/Idh/MocA family oxidoreductase [Algoriphagus sp. TR-M9]WBL42739.1 Gfo/Idh/MocA family oxidoreductase [Algoriphagus sp. TR-M9]